MRGNGTIRAAGRVGSEQFEARASKISAPDREEAAQAGRRMIEDGREPQESLDVFG